MVGDDCCTVLFFFNFFLLLLFEALLADEKLLSLSLLHERRGSRALTVSLLLVRRFLVVSDVFVDPDGPGTGDDLLGCSSRLLFFL